jgi:hypothetical protein
VSFRVIGIKGFMSPYLIFGLAMLGIVIFSLVVTGNLAAGFNERAKRDMRASLEPLAGQLDGTVSVDEAKVEGRFHGQITTGQVVAGPGGMGRLFETTYIEAAGGSGWRAVVRRPKADGEEWERTFDGPESLSGLRTDVFSLLDALLPYPGWFELKYDPDAGSLKLIRAMQSRRDVPSAERFALYLQTLEAAGLANRTAQAEAGVATAAS